MDFNMNVIKDLSELYLSNLIIPVYFLSPNLNIEKLLKYSESSNQAGVAFTQMHEQKHRPVTIGSGMQESRFNLSILIFLKDTTTYNIMSDKMASMDWKHTVGNTCISILGRNSTIPKVPMTIIEKSIYKLPYLINIMGETSDLDS